MKGLTASDIMLILLTGMLALPFNIQTVGAKATIYIRSDGGVDPPTAPIQRDGDVYTFTGNIYDEIVIERSNITIDGMRYMLQGSGSGSGLSFSDQTNVTIKNTNITGFDIGINITSSSFITISKNFITDNDNVGINIWWGPSRHNNISENNITNNFHGIWLGRFLNGTISGNNIANNYQGIHLSSSSNNLLRGNRMNDNMMNFDVWGENLEDFLNDVDSSNTVDDKPVYYWVEKQDMSVSPEAGYVALVNCKGITVQNLNLANNEQGILLAYTTNSTMTKNNISSTYYGIWLYESSNNNIFGNNLTSMQSGYGIHLKLSNYNEISENKITNTNHGIRFEESSNNNITGNIVSSNGDGVHLSDSSSYNSLYGNNITSNGAEGIDIFLYSNFNEISENDITNNFWGINLDSSNHNNISGNNMANNTDGIRVDSSSKNNICGNNIANNYWGISVMATTNKVYHNNFVNNHNQVDGLWWVANFWDDGYPSGGNYWSDYEEKYPDAGEIDGSGIWDTPYVINENSQDNYPLMYPWGALPPTDTTPPTISIVSPENKTYTVENVPLIFTVSEPTSWMGYNLDWQANVTITGNMTLSGLSDGPHSLIVYVNDTAGNTGASEMVYFSINIQQTGPVLLLEWIIIFVVIVIVIGGTTGFILYRKRKASLPA